MFGNFENRAAFQTRNRLRDNLGDALRPEIYVKSASCLRDQANVGKPAEGNALNQPPINRLAADAEKPSGRGLAQAKDAHGIPKVFGSATRVSTLPRPNPGHWRVGDCLQRGGVDAPKLHLPSILPQAQVKRK